MASGAASGKAKTSVPNIVTTTVKKTGGSLVLTVPAPVRDALQLAEGQQMSVSVEDGKVIYEAMSEKRVRRSKYTLEELLAQCDFEQPYSEEERAWLDAPPVGREIL
jgi:antitoxin ChpS